MSLNKPIWKLKDYNLFTNQDMIKLIKKYPEMIDWSNLSRTKNEMKKIEECYNPSIYELDYEQMRNNNKEMYEELIKEVMKPSRVFKNPDYDYLDELFGD